MPGPEMPNTPEGLDWKMSDSLIDPEQVGQTLLNVLARHNEEAAKAGKTGVKDELLRWDNDEHHLPVLSTPGRGNEVVLEVRRKGNFPNPKQIRIGYYSPADDDFVIFPDFIKNEEQAELKEAALIESDQEISRFRRNTNKTLVRLDVRDPAVRDIHRRHNDYFNGTPFLMQILDRSNVSLLEAVSPDPIFLWTTIPRLRSA
jgi:hypothetical protein